MNVSHNLIDTCDGIAHMQLLHTLDLSRNAIVTLQAIRCLAANCSLHTLALAFNR